MTLKSRFMSNKLEELVEYKNRWKDFENDNEELRSQLFDLKLKSGSETSEFRFQRLYESTRDQLQQTKDVLMSCEINNKKLKADNRDFTMQLERLTITNGKKDKLIKKMNFDLEKMKQVEICHSLHDSGILGDNFQYEERIRELEEQLEELKLENEGYAGKLLNS